MSKDPKLCSGCSSYTTPISSYPCIDCKFGLGSQTKWSNQRVVIKVHQDDIHQTTQLAEAHWSYVREVLETHDVADAEIERIGFHYVTAFIHGYKHAKEDYSTGE